MYREVNGKKILARDNAYWSDIKKPIDIAKEMVNSDVFREKWLTSLENIEKQFQRVPAGVLSKSLMTDVYLEKIFRYLMRMSHFVIFGKTQLDYIPSSIKQEFKRENENGMLCVYVNVLMSLLIKRLDLNTLIQFIQGFYKIDFPKDSFNRVVHGEMAVGLHAFTILDNTIIDPTLQQIGDNFSIGDSEFMVIGETLPSFISMYGWVESEDVVYRYAEGYAKEVNMSIHEWLLAHDEVANLLFSTAIKSGEFTYGRNEICFCGSGKKYKKCHLI